MVRRFLSSYRDAWFGLDDLEDCRPFEHDAFQFYGGLKMSFSHGEISNQQLDEQSSPETTKYLKIIPKKTAKQAAIVAVTVGAVMIDSRFISRRMARRFES